MKLAIASVWLASVVTAAWATPPSPRGATADVPAGDVVRGEVGERLDTFFSRLEGVGFSGGAVAVKDGELVFARGYGLADRERRIRFTTDTIFPNGSITKPFTGTLIVKLQTEGLLEFDDRLSDHFDHEIPEDKADIRLHHLLTHSSGLPGAIGYDFEAIEREDYIAAALATPLDFPPGATYEYSNVGFSLLAAVAERVTGETYADLLTEHLLAPAGMTRTGYRLDRFEDRDIACGYLGGEAWGRMRDHAWSPEGPYWHLRGNGGLHTTLRDSYRWHAALLDDTLLSESAREVLFAPRVDEGGGASWYGYGWVNASSQRGTRVLQHDGGNPFFSNDLKRFVDEDAMFYVHSNNGDIKAYRLSPRIERILFGEQVLLPPAVAAVDAEHLAEVAGRYALPTGAGLVVRSDGSRLLLEPDGQQAFSLLLTGEDVDTERRAALAELAAAIVQGAVDGDVSLAHRAFGGRVPLAEVEEMMEFELGGLVERLGGVDDVRGLGTVPAGGGDVPPGFLISSVALSGPNGARVLGLGWMNDRLAGFDMQEPHTTTPAWPVAEDAFTTWSLSSTVSLELVIERDAGGRPVALDISAGETAVRAERTDA